MTRYVVKETYETTFQRLHRLRVHKGTPVVLDQQGYYRMGAEKAERLDKIIGKDDFFSHDARHYYLWVPEDNIEQLQDE